MYGGIFTVLEEIKVEKVIISKQEETSENYQEFLKLVKDKHIKVIEVKKGDRVFIEKKMYLKNKSLQSIKKFRKLDNMEKR